MTDEPTTRVRAPRSDPDRRAARREANRRRHWIEERGEKPPPDTYRVVKAKQNMAYHKRRNGIECSAYGNVRKKAYALLRRICQTEIMSLEETKALIETGDLPMRLWEKYGMAKIEYEWNGEHFEPTPEDLKRVTARWEDRKQFISKLEAQARAREKGGDDG